MKKLKACLNFNTTKIIQICGGIVLHDFLKKRPVIRQSKDLNIIFFQICQNSDSRYPNRNYVFELLSMNQHSNMIWKSLSGLLSLILTGKILPLRLFGFVVLVVRDSSVLGSYKRITKHIMQVASYLKLPFLNTVIQILTLTANGY